MSVPHTTRHAPFGAETVFHLVEGIDRLLTGIRSHFERVATRRELELLSDDQLNDIGLRRGDIDALMFRVRRGA